MRDWIWIAAATVSMGMSLVAAGHVVLYKRDPRAAVSWAGFVLLIPVLGPLLYSAFGVNRVRRRAGRLQRRRRSPDRHPPEIACASADLEAHLGPQAAHLAAISRVAGTLTRYPLAPGNRVDLLVDGEEAYPAMLQAIDGAARSVGLMSYIFEKDAAVGEKFLAALKGAVGRGCQVRVLVDDVSSRDSICDALDADGIPYANFLPIHFPGLGRNRFMNLRNHRKILVVDGRVGFTGGINLRASHLVKSGEGHKEQDTHFRLEGPVVEHLLDAFADDWAFTNGELLVGTAWEARHDAAGGAAARGLPGDPAESREVLKSVIVAALGQARRTVRIVTPYFLPDAALVTALNVAALRGVQVQILVPAQPDHEVVRWAMQAQFWQVLVGGCELWLTPPPFDHSKLMVVDEAWTLLGSANLDPRSLRLNFEFNVEVYDADLAGRVARHIDAKKAAARRVTLKEVDARSLPVRLRDGLARLWTPYL